MKKVFLIAAFFFITVASAQKEQNLGDFNAVRIFDQIDVLLVKSGQNKISISGSNADDVEVVTKNGEVKIRMRLTKLLQGDDVSVTLYYKSIDRIEASEGSRVSSEDTFKATAFELNAKEGSEIKIALDVQKLKSRAHSGGILSLRGSADNHDAKITSGGKLEAENLVTAQTSVSISAGGEADIHATDFADAKTTAGGSIDIYGDPKQVNKKNTAGGDIKVM